LTAGPRRKSRELAMQMLFQADIGKQTPDQVRATFWKAGDEVEPEVRGFAEDLFRVAVAHREQIDNLIVANSKHWRLERMPAVDRNLLRMAVGEIWASREHLSPLSSTRLSRLAAASPRLSPSTSSTGCWIRSRAALSESKPLSMRLPACSISIERASQASTDKAT